MLAINEYVCDAEIKTRTGEYVGCRNNACVSRLSKYGNYLHYCNSHKMHAINPTREQFVPAPLSKPIWLSKR